MEDIKKDPRGRKKIPNRKQIAFYVHMDVYEHMQEICRLLNLRPAQYFTSTIEADYDRLRGNPKTKKFLDQLKALEETLKAMTCGPADGPSDEQPALK